MPPPLPPFVFPTLPATWFIGHMSRALREMRLMIQSQKVDLVIETRDARMPLTSLNPAFESILASIGVAGVEGAGSSTKRLIVYNKRDLAQDCFQEPLRKALMEHGNQHVIFTDSRNDTDVKHLLKTAIRMANRELEGPEDRINMLVAGMPNVGKSSLLNALRRVGVRKGKAASTSSQPGHTRRLSTVIKISIDPPVYIYDTPGIMVPFLGRGVAGKEAALKLALTGGIKESLFEGDTVAEYLIWRLASRVAMAEDGYSSADLFNSLSLPLDTSLSPTPFLLALAHRLKAIRKGGEPDLDFAGRWLIQAFREGKLGAWTLDGLGRGGECVDSVIEEEGVNSDILSSVDSKSIEVPMPIIPAPISSPTTPTPPTSTLTPSESISHSINSTISSYFQSLTSLSSLSNHQAKKAAKVSQAKVREVKRKGFEVTKVTRPGAKGGMGIQSARRRVYRRE